MDRTPRSELTERLQPFVSAIAAADSDLDRLALTLSQALQPSIDPLDTITVLDELAAAVPSPTPEGVMRFLVRDAGFTGDITGYHGWRNSCLDRVVERRQGMPITLSIVAIEVARRVGVKLDAIGMPGHFLVGDAGDREWFADPFNQQWGLSRQDCQAVLQRLGARDWSDRYLAPVVPRLVIARILNNLKWSCQQAGNEVQFVTVMMARQAMAEFADEHDEAVRSLSALN